MAAALREVATAVSGDGRTGTGEPEPRQVAEESRLERRLERAVARATTPRGAAIVIATASTVMTVVAGLLVTVVDGENFPSIGSGLWWAVQTVTTVGYGDNIPMNLAGGSWRCSSCFWGSAS